jgi:hypothetical protein
MVYGQSTSTWVHILIYFPSLWWTRYDEKKMRINLIIVLGEGFAFLIQSSSTLASGNPVAGLGYADQGTGSSGIVSSIAIEFDTTLNAVMNDPNNNHVSVHARPANLANSANENYSLDSIETISILSESQHTVTVTFIPQAPTFKIGRLVVTMVTNLWLFAYFCVVGIFWEFNRC